MNLIQEKYAYNYVYYPKVVKGLLDIYISFCYSKYIKKDLKLLVMLKHQDKELNEWLQVTVNRLHENIYGILVIDDTSKFLNLNREHFEKMKIHPRLPGRKILQYDESLLKEINFILRNYFKDGVIYNNADFLADKLINTDFYLE